MFVCRVAGDGGAAAPQVRGVDTGNVFRPVARERLCIDGRQDAVGFTCEVAMRRIPVDLFVYLIPVNVDDNVTRVAAMSALRCVNLYPFDDARRDFSNSK